MLGSLSNIEVRETRQRTFARWDFLSNRRVCETGQRTFMGWDLCLIQRCVKLDKGLPALGF